MKYVYAFCAWPDETWNIDRSMFELFEMLQMKTEKVCTEAEFEAFRSKLSHQGITLREVERWPYHEPETVQ